FFDDGPFGREFLKAAKHLHRRSKSCARQVQLVNLTLGENEAANSVVGGLKMPKGSALRLGFVFLMRAAVVLMPTRCIGIAIRVHGCACSSFTFGHVSRVFGFGRCERCVGSSKKSYKRNRSGYADLSTHGHSSL